MGAARARTRRSLGHQLLHPQIQIPNACPSDDALLNHSNDVYKHCSVYTGQSVLCGDAIVVLTKPLCIQTIEHDYCLFQERFLPTILWWWCNFS